MRDQHPGFYNGMSNLWSKDEDEGGGGAELGPQEAQQILHVRARAGQYQDTKHIAPLMYINVSNVDFCPKILCTMVYTLHYKVTKNMLRTLEGDKL